MRELVPLDAVIKIDLLEKRIKKPEAKVVTLEAQLEASEMKVDKFEKKARRLEQDQG